MLITEETLTFLVENRMQDSREWFHAQRARYEQAVKAPLYALAEALEEPMAAIDPQIITRPARVISRINRDIRFSKDKTLYRDVMWLSYLRSREAMRSTPAFFFEFSPRMWRYGCGFYGADAKTMAAMRTLILEDHRAFSKARRAYGKQTLFTMEGERYKRLHHPGQPPEISDWLERKSLYFTRESDDFSLLFSQDLPDLLAQGYQILAPIYHFLCSATQRVLLQAP